MPELPGAVEAEGGCGFNPDDDEGDPYGHDVAGGGVGAGVGLGYGSKYAPDGGWGSGVVLCAGGDGGFARSSGEMVEGEGSHADTCLLKTFTGKTPIEMTLTEPQLQTQLDALGRPK